MSSECCADWKLWGVKKATLFKKDPGGEKYEELEVEEKKTVKYSKRKHVNKSWNYLTWISMEKVKRWVRNDDVK